MNKLSTQNSDLINKWMESIAQDLAAQETQMVERLNEQRIMHQAEMADTQNANQTLQDEIQKTVALNEAQYRQIKKLQGDQATIVKTLNIEFVQQFEQQQSEYNAATERFYANEKVIQAELQTQIDMNSAYAQENEELETLLNDATTALATKKIEFNEAQGWIDQLGTVNQNLEKRLSDERAINASFKMKISESYQRILQEQARNLALTEQVKRTEKTPNEIPKEALEAIEHSQQLKVLVEEERKVFDRVTQELNRKIAELENEKTVAFNLIQQVKNVSTIEELSERIRSFETAGR